MPGYAGRANSKRRQCEMSHKENAAVWDRFHPTQRHRRKDRKNRFIGAC